MNMNQSLRELGITPHSLETPGGLFEDQSAGEMSRDTADGDDEQEIFFEDCMKLSRRERRPR